MTRKKNMTCNIDNKELRSNLFKEHPFCFWCGVLVIQYIVEPGHRPEDNMATLDHIKSRFFRKKGEKVEKVLACYRCNQKRAQKENKENKEIFRKYVHKKDGTIAS